MESATASRMTNRGGRSLAATLDESPAAWPPQFRHRRKGEQPIAEPCGRYCPVYMVLIGSRPLFVTLDEDEAHDYADKFNGRPPIMNPTATVMPLDWRAIDRNEEFHEVEDVKEIEALENRED